MTQNTSNNVFFYAMGYMYNFIQFGIIVMYIFYGKEIDFK